MNKTDIENIPISEIRVTNPRTRSKGRFQEIVASIAAVGLKRPITVSRRELEPDGPYGVPADRRTQQARKTRRRLDGLRDRRVADP